jgi:sec-independent protein translocase protein TatA
VGNIGVWEVILLLLVMLVLFGPKRLPEMGRSLGRGMREFKDSLATVTSTAEHSEETVREETVPEDTAAVDPPARSAAEAPASPAVSEPPGTTPTAPSEPFGDRNPAGTPQQPPG